MSPYPRPTRSAHVLLSLLLGTSPIAFAKTPLDQQPVFLEADQLIVEEPSGLVAAQGGVSAFAKGRLLTAERVQYLSAEHLIEAQDSITLFDPTGVVLAADEVTLSDDMENGSLEGLKVWFGKEDARIAAARGHKDGAAQKTVLEHGVYSPCAFCKDDETRPLLWQMRADEIERDEAAGTIKYHDVWLEFFGKRVLYLPYFSHVDPTIRKRSGVLTPFFGNNSDLGAVAGVPYYVDLGPDKDMTITPFIATKQLPILAAEYRQKFEQGNVYLSGSITRSKSAGGTQTSPTAKPERFRGHINSHFKRGLTPNLVLSGHLRRASDQTYLRRYRMVDSSNKLYYQNTLTSDLNLEGFWGQNYGSVRGYAFQGLRDTDNPKNEPIVAPWAMYSHTSCPGTWGQYWQWDGSVVSLNRQKGTDMQRLTSQFQGHLPFQSPIGDLYDVVASFRSDVYHMEHMQLANSTRTINTSVGRVFPQVGLFWRYPLVRPFGENRVLLTPQVSAIAGTNHANKIKIPNEDSLDFELDKTNLFALNRFPGLDILDTGERINYGMNAALYTQRNMALSLFLGQSYDFTENPNFPLKSGVRKGRSDYLSQADIKWANWLRLRYAMRLDYRAFVPRQNQLDGRIGPDRLNLQGNYTFTHKNASYLLEPREQVMLRLNTKWTPMWSTYVAGTRDLKSGGTLAQGAGIRYEDECFAVDTSYTRTFYRDRDIVPQTTVQFTVSLKTLGSVSTGSMTPDFLNRTPTLEDKLALEQRQNLFNSSLDGAGPSPRALD